MGRIKVILWDIDGTILNFLEAEKCAIRKCFSVFAMGECTDDMLKRYSKINRSYWEQLERGEISKIEVLEGRFREFFEAESLDVTKAAAFNQEYQIRLGDTICFCDHADELLKSLKGKVKQCAVTNGTMVAQKRKLINSGLDQIFDKVFISDEIGAEKPTQAFFDAVWKEIGFYEKDEVMIVGDSLSSDMQGGNNAGIICCWYNPRKEKCSGIQKINYEIQNLQQVLDILYGKNGCNLSIIKV